MWFPEFHTVLRLATSQLSGLALTLYTLKSDPYLKQETDSLALSHAVDRERTDYGHFVINEDIDMHTQLGRPLC